MSLLRVLLILVVSAHLAVVSDAQVITDFSKFTDSLNMLNSASHDREQAFEIDGTQINIVESEAPFNGSASQQLFGTDEFPAFTTEGYRLSVDFTEIDWDLNRLGSTNSRAGLMTSSAIPDGGTTSGDVRADGDYFYWVYRAGSVMAGMYTFDGIEQEGGLVSIGQAPDPVNDVEGVVHGLYMERVADNGGSWDLGWIDADGNDVFVQNRNTINGVDITADGTYVGLYSDMRTHTATVVFDNLSYGPVASNSLIGDCSNDGILGVGDLVCLSTLEERDAVLGAIGTLPGDLDGDGQVAFADFLVIVGELRERIWNLR